MLRSSNPHVRKFGIDLASKYAVKTPEQPTYGTIGQDQFGNPQYGWIDRGARTTTPAAGGQPTFKEASALRKEVQDLPSYKNLAQSAPVYRSMLDAAGLFS